ncbi:MAG: DUF1573 domain-containing protein [Thermoguttaceae bacterium]
MYCKAARAALVVILFSVPASAQEWAAKMFSTTSNDFGVVARGTKAEYSFALENLYVEDVHIADVRASCSCTTPEIKMPTLKTHEKGAILAKFNTSAFLGSKGATLTVTFDKPYFAEVQLQVRGYIRGDVALTPGIVDFGEVDEDSQREKEILVNYAGGDDWQIVAARCANPHLSATATEVSRGGGQVTYRVAIRLDKQAPSGSLADRVVLMTNDSQGREVAVPIEGVVPARIALSPDSLFMGLVEPGQKVTKQLVVRSREPFRVNEVTCDGPGFAAAVPDGASERKVHLVSVTFAAGKQSMKAEATVHVTTSIGTAPPATVRVTVTHPEAASRR